MRRFLLCAATCAACQPPVDAGANAGPVPVLPQRQPVLNAPCSLGPTAPTGLLVTTTDFSTGAVSVVDVATHEVGRDVALGTPDAIPFFAGGRGLIVHRFQYDVVEVLDPGRNWASAGQHRVEVEGVSGPNPRAIALAGDGLAYVPLFGAAQIQVMDLALPPGSALQDTIDLRAFGDADGVPEASLAVACGDALFVTIDRIDTAAGFVRSGGDGLVAVDLIERTALDLDPDEDGAQGIESLGAWIKQMRLDPTDPEAQTLLLLTEGIERVDLRDGTVTWAVPPDAFVAAGIDHYQLPVAFDVEGERVFVAAYAPAGDARPDCATDPSPCFGQVRLFETQLDGTAPLTAFAEGFDAVERTLEVVDTQLWYGSRKSGAPGLWVYDVEASPPTLLDGPIATGLPPYALTPVVLP